MSRFISEHVKAEKQGFPGLDRSWFKGQSIEFVRRTLLDRKAPIYEFVDPELVGQMLQEHMRARRTAASSSGLC